MAQLVGSMSGVVLGSVVKVVDLNLAAVCNFKVITLQVTKVAPQGSLELKAHMWLNFF